MKRPLKCSTSGAAGLGAGGRIPCLGAGEGAAEMQQKANARKRGRFAELIVRMHLPRSGLWHRPDLLRERTSGASRRESNPYNRRMVRAPPRTYDGATYGAEGGI